MQTYSTLNDAKALAKFAHFSQKDKAGFDYIEHPLRVLAAVQGQGAPPYVQMAAVLHDVTEDTAFTPDILLALGFSEAVVGLVRLLDRHESKNVWVTEAAADYTADGFYYHNISRDYWATVIKLADIADNSQPWRLAYLSPETQDRLRAKYLKARSLLGDY